MRVGIISLYHESNTFNPCPTTLDDFKAQRLLIGKARATKTAGAIMKWPVSSKVLRRNKSMQFQFLRRGRRPAERSPTPHFVR